jgi:hypothetical protein
MSPSANMGILSSNPAQSQNNKTLKKFYVHMGAPASKQLLSEDSNCSN